MKALFSMQNWFLENVGNIDLETIKNWFLFNPKQPLLFNSALFLGFFLIFYVIYILSRKTHYFRITYVVLFSLFFYYKSSGVYFWILIFSSVVDYSLSRLIYVESKQFYRKFYLILSLVINLGMLAYFKYTNFFIANYNSLFDGTMTFEDIVLPVGISFYTFQTLSYTIDVYRRELEPTKSFMDFLFFVSFFPQLVAGPIVRASDFIPQIYEKLKLTKEDFNRALFLIIGGLLKKAVISDYISSNFVDRVFDAPNSYTAFENLMASYGYAIQIYCDFSGYSDIAIGLALLMGFWLPDNFRTPYQSASITEFWRRWHISLSSWLRDYLYISMGGNRKGKIRTYFNLFMTMLLGGLWHGASWKFVVWGVLHGLALVVEKFFGQFIKLPKNSLVRTIQVVLTFHFVVFCWLFFRAKDFTTAFQIADNITKLTFDFNQWQTIILGYKNVFLLIAIGVVWHFIPVKMLAGMQKTFSTLPLVAKAVLLGLIYWVVYATASADAQPFIYFQF
ncbi:MBOAT family protein [Flavobacterium cucumis]|uniref:D-alanyl-lipoteichoic acid acyltransferase DltB, MBOAT superfamily n=2 Tax=Flavobacterium cucumis TaxID=416016 RepID=A0A1M7ZWS7_9FLAO|nr:D-alanyl-lipoteichoic acid acyltransferase DltB, MBOAT superfamily [Flavobacterium cucumis]